MGIKSSNFLQCADDAPMVVLGGPGGNQAAFTRGNSPDYKKKTHLEIRDLDNTSVTDMSAVATATVVQRTFSVTMLN